MSRLKYGAIILSILLPIAIPLFTAFMAQNNLRSAPLIKVNIEPYDPRDLLYGHYMTFRINWNWKGGTMDPAACTYGECCLCVGEGNVNPEVSLTQCLPGNEKPAACVHSVKGTVMGGSDFNVGIDRYYVDENIALPLEQLFRDKKEDFMIGLTMIPVRPAVENLYVGGEPLREYIKTRGSQIFNPAATQP